MSVPVLNTGAEYLKRPENSKTYVREQEMFELKEILSDDKDASAGEEFSENLYAGAAVLMDADSGRVLYGKNENAPMAMASTTKIMTCILILEKGNLEDDVQVSSYAASMPKVKLYIKKGESYQVKDLLHSLMLESHNDSAVALAEYLGSQYLPGKMKEKAVSEHTEEESKQAVAAFAFLMNQKAKEIGCGDTYFITPNGLDATETFVKKESETEDVQVDENAWQSERTGESAQTGERTGIRENERVEEKNVTEETVQEETTQKEQTMQKEHHTTAKDLAKIMSYCITQSEKKEEFLNITRAPNYVFTANGRSYSCNNHNAFLNMMTGALSGKTGFTNKAGYCYVGALERDDRTFVVALLACGWPNHKTYKWSDTKELMQYGVEHFFYRDFTSKEVAFDESRLKPLPVENGRTEILGETPTVEVGIRERQNTEANKKRNAETNADVNTATQEDLNIGKSDNTVEENQKAYNGILMRPDEKVTVEYRMLEGLTAPVKKGTPVGKIYYVVDDTIYRQETIVAEQDMEKVDFKWCFLQIYDRFCLE